MRSYPKLRITEKSRFVLDEVIIKEFPSLSAYNYLKRQYERSMVTLVNVFHVLGLWSFGFVKVLLFTVRYKVTATR